LKRDCPAFLKLRKSETFMAKAKTYDKDEVACLNVLMSTTNCQVCKYCLDKDCDGQSCVEDTPAMASAKHKFFNDGSYEHVLLAKLDRPANEYGHSLFTKDSYLTTFQD
jgi:hypothetical protein